MKFSEGFATIALGYAIARAQFGERMLKACPGMDWTRISTDDYDNSIEFHDVPNAIRLTEAAQQLLHKEGFAQAWLNHPNGWETHYGFLNFPRDGFRKHQFHDGKRTRIEVEHFPPSWPEEWLTNGYVTVVPPATE